MDASDRRHFASMHASIGSDEIPVCPVCTRRVRRIGGSLGGLVKCTACGLLLRYPQPVDAELQALYETSWSAPKANPAVTGSIDSHIAVQYVRLLSRVGWPRGYGGSQAARRRRGGRQCVHSVTRCRSQRVGGRAIRIRARSATRRPRVSPARRTTRISRVRRHRPHECNRTRTEAVGPSSRVALQVGREGWLFIATPNAAGLNARMFRSRWREARNKVHLHMFTPRSLDTLLMKCGFPFAIACARA